MSLAASAQKLPEAQPAPATQVYPVQPADPQAEVNRLNGLLKERTNQADDLKTRLDALSSEQEHVPRFLRGSILLWILPVSAAVLALIALFWSAALTAHGASVRKAVAQQREKAKRELDQLRDEILAYQAMTRKSPQPPVAASKRPVVPAATTPRPPAPVEAPRPQPLPESPVEPIPVVLAPAAPTSAPESAPAPAPDPRVLTGNLLDDYNTARTLEHDGPELFQEFYRPIGLSCTNLSDARPGEALTLRFREAARGMFLAVQHEGETLVLPALDKDFAAVRPSLEGVFTYPPPAERPARLVRPATVRKSGDEWTLLATGEIARG